MRNDKRSSASLRKIKILNNYIEYAEGSCLFEIGNTKVICTASIEKTVPHFLRGKQTGWITAEYSMLPRSCKTRVRRESARGKISGRTHEIQRLIGRSLRSVCNLGDIGERTIWIDCDVIQADGGTRCASISGSFIALHMALNSLKKKGEIETIPIREKVAAVSVGIVDKHTLLDLNYDEDSAAEVDMNVVMTQNGKFVEIQGTAEKEPFSKEHMNKLINLAKKGLKEIFVSQDKALKRIK